jgi:uncharacterized membrane protein YedE/YeeE
MTRRPGLAAYFAIGLLFGIVITKGEVISWFRIQEMFRFQGIYMFGVFATALATAIASVQWLKRRGRTLNGDPIQIAPKAVGSGARYLIGGSIFGLGWAFTGACPGPLFALAAGGVPVMFAAIAAAMAGTWTYGVWRAKFPH